jgi:hypothetical protein
MPPRCSGCGITCEHGKGKVSESKGKVGTGNSKVGKAKIKNRGGRG